MARRDLLLRRLNRPINQELRRAGLPVPVTHRCFVIDIAAPPMPEWAVRKTLKGFKITPTQLVLKSRVDAFELVEQLKSRGAHPLIERFEFRRCNARGRLLVGNEATDMREWERSHPGEKTICGPDCSTRSAQKTAKSRGRTDAA